MRRALRAGIINALDAADDPLGDAATVVQEAFGVDRVSIARIHSSSRRFEIAADAGAELLAPGTTLPVGTCSYFALAAEGRTFQEDDFDASRTFQLPLDNVVLAAGFHSGCSVPIRRAGQAVGAISLSAAMPRADMTAFVDSLEPLGDLLATAMGRRAPARPATVLICHSDPLVGRGLARLVELDEGAGATLATTLADAIAAVTRARPDVVVCDDWMDGLQVDRFARALREAGADAPLLVVSSRDAPESVRASLAAGAAAHIARRDAVAQLRTAVDAVRNGATMFPAPSAQHGRGLTLREREVLEALEEGLRFKQVARRLGVSEATAKTHGRNLFRKLGATSRAEAVHAARDRGLIP